MNERVKVNIVGLWAGDDENVISTYFGTVDEIPVHIRDFRETQGTDYEMIIVTVTFLD